MMTLICGLPRAGKTTYSERFGNVIHLDTSGAYKGVLHRLKMADGDIVVEGVYQRSIDRIRLINGYKTDRYKCIWLDTADEVRRSRKGWNNFCDQPFEPPTYAEGWDEIIIIRGQEEQHITKERTYETQQQSLCSEVTI